MRALLLLALPTAAQELTDADLAALAGADVVIVGEIHGNPAHHDLQAALAARLAPAALVFEQIAVTDEATVRAGLAARRTDPDIAAEIGWEASGWPDFSLYAQTMRATDAAVFGAAIPRDVVRRAAAEGAAAVLGADAGLFGLDRPLPADEQAERQAIQAAVHCDAMPEHLLPGMVEAQRLRDAAFAASVLRALAAEGPPVLMVTGNGHARTDWGVPAFLAEARPDLTVIAIGQEESAPSAMPFDIRLITPPVARPDPCDAFR